MNSYSIDKGVYEYNQITDFLSSIGELEQVTKKKRGRGEKCVYFNTPCAFDIETSSWYENKEKRACMYVWQLGINGACLLGRTYEQLKQSITTIQQHIGFDIDHRLVVYVQDLRYEYQFIKHWFNFVDVFELEDRRPVKAVTAEGIEFRCSYVLTGKSLEKIGKDLLKYKVEKAVGKLDYNKIRHSGTPLTEDEIEYCVNDIKVVMALIAEKIEQDGDITKIPMTKTSYVRRICRDRCFGKGSERTAYSRFMKRLTMTDEVYDMSKKAFQGGYVHCNPYYSCVPLKDVDSYDFTSSYIATMVAHKWFPMTTPIQRKNCKTEEDYIYYAKKYACLAEITFEGLELKDDAYMAPISSSKCIGKTGMEDNGRIIDAETITMTITEQDYYVYKDFYNWKSMTINKMYTFERDYLPTQLIDVVLELYEKKTQYKDVEGMEFEYNQAKENLNSVPGMCVTDIMKQSDSLEDYNSSFTRFLYYPWGVWITAISRRMLFTGIKECGEDIIYCDTDSLKLVNGEAHRAYIKTYNDWITRKLEKAMEWHGFDVSRIRPKDKNGIERPLGIWNYEGRYTRFKAARAKAYITETNGNYSLTLSGVSKKEGIKYLIKQGDPIELFDNQLVFPAENTGKLCHTYIDDEIEGQVVDYLGNKGVYHEKSCIHMEPVGYDMNIENDYLRFLDFVYNGIVTK